MLPAISSLKTTYGLVASPYLTPVVNYTAFSLDTLPQRAGHRRTLENIFSAPYDHCPSHVFRVPYVHCHSAVFSVLYGHCHSAVFSALYGHCHSAPYRHSAVVMNVPSPRTASCQNNAAASHSCHFNTVLYPRSYSECQLPLNCNRRDIRGASSSVQNYRKIFAVTTLSSLAPLQTCQHIYNAIQRTAITVQCNAADLLRLLP